MQRQVSIVVGHRSSFWVGFKQGFGNFNRSAKGGRRVKRKIPSIIFDLSLMSVGGGGGISVNKGFVESSPCKFIIAPPRYLLRGRIRGTDNSCLPALGNFVQICIVSSHHCHY
jgi:hypothetical protein